MSAIREIDHARLGDSNTTSFKTSEMTETLKSNVQPLQVENLTADG